MLVVASGRHGTGEELGEREPARPPTLGGEPGRPLDETLGVDPAEAGRGPCRVGHRAPQPGPRRAGGQRAAGEAVGRERGAERRGEQPQQRRLVVRVGERREVVGEVLDLLARPEPAAARRERGQPGILEGALVGGDVRGRADEDDDVARRRLARLHQLGDPLREQPRLRPPPGGPAGQRAEVGVVPGGAWRLAPARRGGRVGDQQLDQRSARRSDLAPRDERLEARAVQRAGSGVDGREDLGPGPEVAAQHGGGALARTRVARGAEDLDRRVTKAVDRLELVADDERLAPVEPPQQPHLERVGVLELVHHDPLEAVRPGVPERGRTVEERAHGELEVVEVHRRAGALGRCVGVGVAPEQLAEQPDRGGAGAVPAGCGVALERLQVGAARLGVEGLGPSRREGGRLEGAQGRGDGPGEHLVAPGERRARTLHHRALEALQARRGGGARGAERRPQRGGVLELRRPGQLGARVAGAAQRVVDAEHGRPEAVHPVGGDKVERLVAGRRGRVPEEVGDRPLEGRLPQLAARGLVEHDERGVEARRHRVGAQHPRAEAVDGAHRCCLGVLGQATTAHPEQPGADPRPQLARRLLGERDREHPPGVDPVVGDEAHEALDEHRGLAGSRVGGEQQRAGAPADRLLLLGREAWRAPHYAASQRQIDGWAQPPL